MPNWKKVVVSGSDATLNSLEVIHASGSFSGSFEGVNSGSFSGSFEGDGSNLTGVATPTGSFTGSFTGSYQGDGSGLTGIVANSIGFSNNVTFSTDYTTTADTYNALYGPLALEGDVTISVTEGSFLKIESFNDILYSISSSIAETASYYGGSVISASFSETSSIANSLKENINVTLDTGSFNYITAPTASFGFIQSITGSAKIIGDAFIILNADSPTERYSGLKVYDSGSTDTGSLEYDSVNNHWFYESTNEGYASGLISGPRDTRGAITFPSNNTIVKGIGGNHIDDSNITDDGNLITLDSTLYVTNSAVGIGTNNPTNNLHIVDATEPQIRLARGTSYYWDIGHFGSDFQLKSQTGGTIMHLNYTGEVGIGTTSPSNKLDVVGTVSASAYIGEGSQINGVIASQSVNNNASSASLSFWQGSQAEYDLISASADPNTIYFVV